MSSQSLCSTGSSSGPSAGPPENPFPEPAAHHADSSLSPGGVRCNFWAWRLPSGYASALRTDPDELFAWLNSSIHHAVAAVHNINDSACLITVIQTLSIIIRNGEGPSLGRQARSVKLSMRKDFVLSQSSLGSGGGGEQRGGTHGPDSGRHDPGRLVHLLVVLMTWRLLET